MMTRKKKKPKATPAVEVGLVLPGEEAAGSVARSERDVQEPETVGQRLLRKRQELGWPLEEASMRTKIHHSVIEAMEADQWDRLPSPSLARGFIRIYARALRLDPEVLLESVDWPGNKKVKWGVLTPEGLETLSREQIHRRHQRVARLLRQSFGSAKRVGTGMLLFVFLLGLVYLGIGWWRLSDGPEVAPQLASAESGGLSRKGSTVGGSPTPKIPRAEVVESDTTSTPEVRKIDGVEVRVARPVVEGQEVTSPRATVGTVQNSLRLVARQDAWARVEVWEGETWRQLFEGAIAAGATIPPGGQSAFKGAAFRLLLNEAGAFDVIINDQRRPQQGGVKQLTFYGN